MNSSQLIGRLTADPELSYTQQGTAVCKFTLAVDRPVRAGEDKQTDFIRITVWGKQAEACNNYLSKGRQVGVQGRIQTGSYTNKEGQKVYTTEVVSNHVYFLAGGNSSRQDQQQFQQGVHPEPNFGEVPQGFVATNPEDEPNIWG